MAEPSPWAVVNDYTKTISTLASALLAFTITFYSNVGKDGPFAILFMTWTLFVIAIAAALYSAARLTSYLRDKQASPDQALLCSNVASFALFGGILFFFVYALLAHWRDERNVESLRAAAAAEAYAKSIDPTSFATVRIHTLTWDSTTLRWNIVLSTGTTTARMAVEPDGTVRDFARQP